MPTFRCLDAFDLPLHCLVLPWYAAILDMSSKQMVDGDSTLSTLFLLY